MRALIINQAQILAVLMCWLHISACNAQKYKSETGSISFFSEAAVEDIAAINEKASSLFNSATGEIAFLVTIPDFEFVKSLMQEHFNEKYMESDQFPKASFKGRITGYDMSSDGAQSVNAIGVLTIHGQSKELTTSGKFEIHDGEIKMTSAFVVKLADYNIKIPKLLWRNIAEQVEVKTVFTYRGI
jgi:hypothetical protein